MHFFKVFILSCLVCFSVSSETINTFYGELEIKEPILLDLIKSPALQRLKSIHQYGVAYYTTHRENYNRYEHSLGVMAILRKNNASLEEQVAGLLHDVSHTVFSHVGDWVFKKDNQEDDYQGIIFKIFLSYSGIEKILLKYGYTTNQIFPKNPHFTRLEQPLPDLCADRIDYNIQGAYYRGFIDKEEALEVYNDLQFSEGIWWAKNSTLLKKVANFSIFMSKDCWGSPENHLMSSWLAEAIHKGLDKGLFSWHDFHLGVDQDVWDLLYHSADSYIKTRMDKIIQPYTFFKLVDPCEADMIITFKSRGIDPWIESEGEKVRLSTLDKVYAQELKALQELSKKGWSIKILDGIE